MKPCPRPLDPLDAEAIASGAAPLVAADAAAHAGACPACGEAVARAARLLEELDRLSLPATSPEPGTPPGPRPDLADRVVRLRPFSRRERRQVRLWLPPLLLSAALFAAGLASLVGPALSAREQAGLSFAALAPLLAVFRAALRWLGELASASPAGLEALSGALRGQPLLGLAALLLLVPALFGVRLAVARRSRS